MTIESLPKILILHLKRFIYSKSGSQKLQKVIDYPLMLTIDKGKGSFTQQINSVVSEAGHKIQSSQSEKKKHYFRREVRTKLEYTEKQLPLKHIENNELIAHGMKLLDFHFLSYVQFQPLYGVCYFEGSDINMLLNILGY